MDTSKISIDILAANLDKVPALMAKMKVQSPRVAKKFPVLGTNHSYSMGEIMRPDGHSGDQAYEQSRSRRMKDQALKVLKRFNELSTEDENAIAVRDLGDIAKIAAKTLDSMSKSRNDAVNFSNYDVGRRKSITYETFSDILSNGNSGLSPKQKYALATSIDKEESGVLDYNNIMDAIVNVEKSHAESTSSRFSAKESEVVTSSQTEGHEKKSDPNKLVTFNDNNNDRKNNDNNNNNNNNNNNSSSSSNNFDNSIANNESKAAYSEAHARSSQPAELPAKTTSNLGKHLIDHVKDILVPRDVNNSLNSQNVKEIFDQERDHSVHSVKRMYHDSFVRNYEQAVPYYRDDTSYNVRKSVNDSLDSQTKKVKRPTSAPPRNKRPPAVDTTDSTCSKTDDSNENNASYHNYLFSSASPKAKYITQLVADKTPDEIKDSIVEKRIASQINGNINGIRHSLRLIDKSRSGCVNFDEFKAVLHKFEVEVPEKSLEKYFNSKKESTQMEQSHGLGIQKLLNIDNFISNLNTVSCNSPTLKRSTEELIDNESRRVFKHINHSLNKTSDPLLVFKHLNEHNRGFVTENQLREGLKLNGTVVSEPEFSLLTSKLESNDGLYALSDIDNLLHTACNVHDVNEKEALANKYRENQRYSRSFQSNVTTLALHTKQEEYNSLMSMSQIYRNESMYWHKLKGALRNKHREFAKIFSDNQDLKLDDIKQENVKDKIDFQEFSRRAANAGVFLGSNDKTVLEIQLQRYAKSDKFDLKTFCDLIETPIEENANQRPYINVTHPQSKVLDGGLFARATQNGSNTFSTTLLAENSERDMVEHSRRRNPKPLSEYYLEPSKFWEMPQGFAVDPLLPHPLPSFRDLVRFNHRDEGTRIALNSSICQESLHPKPRSQLRQSLSPKSIMSDLIFGTSTANISNSALFSGSSTNSILIEGGGKRKVARPTSAPPRSVTSSYRLNLCPDSSAATEIPQSTAPASRAQMSPKRTLRKILPHGGDKPTAPFALGY